MLRSVWRRLEAVSPTGTRRSVGVGLISAVVGFAEATTLVMFVYSAIGVSGTDGVPVAVPVFGDVSQRSAVTVALVMALVTLGANLWNARTIARVSAAVVDDARTRAIEVYVTAEWATKSQEPEGATLRQIGVVPIQYGDAGLYLAQVVGSAASLVVLGLVALWLDLAATLVIVAVGLIVIAVTRPIAKRSDSLARLGVDESASFATQNARMVDGSMELSLYGVENAFADRLLERGHALARLQERQRYFARIAGSLHRDAALVLLAAGLAAAYVAGATSIAPVGAVLLIVVRSLAYNSVLQQSMQLLRELWPVIEEHETYLGRLRTALRTNGVRAATSVLPVELVGVEFSYGDADPVLRGVELCIRPNEVVGIVGSSGGGKSTLLQVLVGLRQPTAGRVVAGGHPYEDYDPSSWAGAVAIVPQEPQLMAVSVMDNVRFFRHGISDEEVETALQRAAVRSEIESLPQGPHTVMGPRGSGLSGGQKQRVAIARALVGRPQLLVLDEPSSALDVDSERLLRDTLRALRSDMAVVVVAHRLSTLEVCDRVVRLRNGRIEPVDSPSQVVASDLA